MKITIDQALQRAVAAHREGKLEEAEFLYRSILRSQPYHPDANHNLGVLAISVNKSGLALPLFKTALESNPNKEQFWLSYIEALAGEKQLDNAKHALDKAKKHGLSNEKLAALEGQLSNISNEENSTTRKPSQQLFTALLQHYNKREFDCAEELATAITQEFPRHGFGWKVLGAVLLEMGRIYEAVTANTTAVNLSPSDSEAHNNLGNALQVLGRVEEAEAYTMQAIALNPGLAEAHSNLGVTLQQLGRLDASESSFRRAIMLKANSANSYCNFGVTLKKQGKLKEAGISYKQAIVLNVNYADAYSNLGNTLKELGKLGEAGASYKQSIIIKPSFSEAHYNLGNALNELRDSQAAEQSYNAAIRFDPQYAEAYFNLGIHFKK